MVYLCAQQVELRQHIGETYLATKIFSRKYLSILVLGMETLESVGYGWIMLGWLRSDSVRPSRAGLGGIGLGRTRCESREATCVCSGKVPTCVQHMELRQHIGDNIALHGLPYPQLRHQAPFQGSNSNGLACDAAPHCTYNNSRGCASDAKPL